MTDTRSGPRPERVGSEYRQPCVFQEKSWQTPSPMGMKRVCLHGYRFSLR